jgi:hypothetical protein
MRAEGKSTPWTASGVSRLSAGEITAASPCLAAARRLRHDGRAALPDGPLPAAQ